MEDERRILHPELKKTTRNLEEETQDHQRRMRNGKCVGSRKWIPTTRVFTLTKDIEQLGGPAKDKNGNVNTCNPFEVLAKNTTNEGDIVEIEQAKELEEGEIETRYPSMKCLEIVISTQSKALASKNDDGEFYEENQVCNDLDIELRKVDSEDSRKNEKEDQNDTEQFHLLATPY
ncbi:hypothetical protein H5410_052597 [Solanum commersonii]|uniref:Uncharacterized protein n=1 Tax=Solanum commersonii TaxID=4109 RepID=A0A9J5X1X9_SOLCO|nr:hypothetical protein H5410_052597 [Solanum commersonii]